MALRLPSTSQVVANADDKEHEQRKRSDGSPPGRYRRDESHRHYELGQRENKTSGGSQDSGNAKVDQGLP
jgi:hypothetical protein